MPQRSACEKNGPGGTDGMIREFAPPKAALGSTQQR